jgi:hypothetical protein
LFDRDAFQAARLTILAQTHVAASAGTPGNLTLQRAREVVAGELLAEQTKDAGMLEVAQESHERKLGFVAALPSADADDVTIKLAMLVREIVAHGDEGAPSTPAFVLAAAALADLIILAGQPITLPLRATEAIRGPEDTAYWRQQAAAAAVASDGR